MNAQELVKRLIKLTERTHLTEFLQVESYLLKRRKRDWEYRYRYRICLLTNITTGTEFFFFFKSLRCKRKTHINGITF